MEKLHAECEQHKKAAHELAKVARTAKQEVSCAVPMFHNEEIVTGLYIQRSSSHSLQYSDFLRSVSELR